jgi:hypothetical protein
VLRVETESATIKTFFTNLTPRFEAMPGGTARHKDNQVRVLVWFEPLLSISWC